MTTTTKELIERGRPLTHRQIWQLQLNRDTALFNNKCSWCEENAGDFRDEVSKIEYRVSGLCQTCQDKTFKEDMPNDDR